MGAYRVGGASTHAPATHDCVPGHALPHAPQLLRSVVRVTSHPFAGFASQFAFRGRHMKPQVPAMHVGLAPEGALHARRHAPQLAMLVMSASHPFAAFASQSDQPDAQVSPHRPIVHVALVAWSGTAHGITV